MVHRPARAQPARGDARTSTSREVRVADGADRDRARAVGRRGTTVRDGCRGCSASRNFARAGRAPLDVDAIAAAILDGPRARQPGDVPRVGAARRQAVSADVAADRARGRRPDQGGARLDASTSTIPQLTIHVEALTDEAFYFFGKERGAGGLPVGVSGRVACLLSGGIDSPVAAWRMMRRGCRVALRPLPQLSDPVARVAGEGARAGALLTRYQFDSRLLLVPFGEIQQRSSSPSRRRCGSSIYRRLMMRIAERIARLHRAQALVTGEVVGQVASQTLENLTTINERRDAAGAAAARSAWTRTRSRRGAAARHLSDLDHSRSGLLHAVHAAASGDARAAVGRRARRGRRCRSTRSSSEAVAATRPWRSSSFP